MEREEEEKLKVVDKRRFRIDDDGNLIENPRDPEPEPTPVVAAPEAAPTPEAAPAPAAAPELLQAPAPEPAPAAAPAPAEAPLAAPAEDAEPAQRPAFRTEPMQDQGVAFMEFVRQQAFIAMVYLGQQPNPSTGLIQAQPEGVREIIDVLVMLRGRTMGNVTREEFQGIDDLIRQLQMAYLQATGGAPGGPPVPNPS